MGFWDATAGRMYSFITAVQLEGYKTLKEGDEVEFDVIQGDKGPQADQVVRTRQV
jgi:cold shock protein